MNVRESVSVCIWRPDVNVGWPLMCFPLSQEHVWHRCCPCTAHVIAVLTQPLWMQFLTFLRHIGKYSHLSRVCWIWEPGPCVWPARTLPTNLSFLSAMNLLKMLFLYWYSSKSIFQINNNRYRSTSWKKKLLFWLQPHHLSNEWLDACNFRGNSSLVCIEGYHTYHYINLVDYPNICF